LASALAASGRAERAADVDRVAAEVFRALGAQPPSWIPRTQASETTSGTDPAGLSTREREIIGLLAMGLSNEEISERLFLSIRTVERHISNIYVKLGATGRHARAYATAYAHEHALV
jgi:DNA-binding NarL/FixJ family response regulator